MNGASIAITGLGCVGAGGVGRGALAAALAGGGPRLAAVDRSAGYHRPDGASTAALVEGLETSRWIPPLEARRMSAPSRFAVIAAREALAEAGLAVPAEPDPGVAVALATAFGPADWTQRLLDQLLREGPAAASPALFTESVVNAPAGRVALACRAAGANHTIVQGEAGPLLALARGAAEVAGGRARVALAGAVEEITPFLHAALDAFRALARPGEDCVERAQPFDQRRQGFLAAEGASLFVLEPEDGARARGVPILARLRGACAAFDATASRVGWGRGAEALAARLRRGLARHDLAPGDIDLVVSGASGGRASDRLEAGVLRRLWEREALPPVVAPKATTGEYAGLYLAAATLLVAGLWRQGLPALEAPDPELGVDLLGGTLASPPRRALVSGLAAGGAAAWLVLERP